jgi:SpoIID/LytB domain protein
VILRDAAGRTVASDPRSLLIEPVDERKSAIYLQAIRDVGAWRSSSLEKAPSYRGPIRFGVGGDGALVAVNELPLEYYLLGVVGPEIGNFAPEEALKAQAVAARSEAWAKLRQGYVSKDPLYDFTDASPQVYRGWREENAAVRRAVDATRGQILTWHGQPVDAVYGHSCGGIVAEASEVWGGAPLAWSRRRSDRQGEPRAVELQSWNAAHDVTRSDSFDSFCSPHQEGFPRYAEKHFRWTRSFSVEDLTRIIDPVYRTGRVRRLEVENRAASGRVQRLRIVGDRRSVVLNKELHIRGALGNLKSTFFTFTTDNQSSGDLDRVYFYGAGYGHGVGMCQMGAYMMAKRGYGYREILHHYFRGTTMESLYP